MNDEFDCKCARCDADTRGSGLIMSMFNTDMICITCKEKEKKHPKYQEAQEAERAAVQRGERDFPGIGKPDDL